MVGVVRMAGSSPPKPKNAGIEEESFSVAVKKRINIAVRKKINHLLRNLRMAGAVRTAGSSPPKPDAPGVRLLPLELRKSPSTLFPPAYSLSGQSCLLRGYQLAH